MQLARRRYLTQFEFGIKAAWDRGDTLALVGEKSVLGALDVVKAAIAARQAAMTITAGNKLKLTRAELKDSTLSLLFRRSDSNASPPVWEHSETEVLRTGTKDAKENQALSAHMFISRIPIKGTKYIHRCVVEEVDGISKSDMYSLLKRIFKSHKYSYDDGKGNDKETYSVVRIEGVPSENLGAAVQRGSLPYVELARAPDTEGLDGAVLAKPETMKIYLRAQGDSALPVIDRLQGWAQAKGWTKFRVQVVGDDGRSKLVPLTPGQKAAEALFVRGQYVDLKNGLDQCSSTVSGELHSHASKILADAAQWPK